MILQRGFSAALLFALSIPVVYAQSGPAALNISGGLYNPNGQAIVQNHVNFKLEILDKNSSCVLYRELHTGEDLSNTKGGFSLLVGRGSSIQNLISGGTSALTAQVFENPGTPQSFSGCGSVTMSSGDERMIRVYYDLGSGYTAMAPDVPIVSSAYAMVAESLQGKHASDFLQVNGTATGSLNQTNADYAFSLTNWPKLKDLLDGTSAQYMSGSPTVPVNLNGQRLTNLASPSTTSDAVTKGYADGSIGGKTADVSGIGPAIGDGKTLVWDATAGKWVTGTPAATDSTKLPLAGGTMSGAITMGGFDLAATGHITMSPQKALTLGNFTDAQETTLVSGLTAANKGASWYNTDHSVYKIWNGTQAVQQAWLDAITSKLSAAWFPATTVVAGSYGTSGAKVPNFTVGADGRLTAAGETVISGVAPGGTAAGDLTGSYPAPLIATNAVTNTKINNGAITTGKLSSTIAAAGGQVLLTDSIDPNKIAYFSCAPNEIMKWTIATGWACTTVASLSPVTSVAGKSGAVTLNAGDITGLGQAALLDYGTAAAQLVQLDGTGHILPQLLPAGSGTITGVTAGSHLLGGGAVGVVTLNVDTGVGAGQVVALNGTAQLPPVDGSLLTSVNAVKLQSRAVAATAPGGGQVLGYNSSLNVWEPMSAAVGSVTSVTSGPGLVGGPITSSGSLYVDMGTTAGKVVQLNGGAGLPAVDGSLLRFVNAIKLQSYDVSAVAPTPNQVLKWNGSTNVWEGQADVNSGGTLTYVQTANGLLGGPISATGTLAVDTGTGANQIVQLNGTAQLPMVDGSLLTSVNAVKLQSRAVAATAPGGGQVLGYNSSLSVWEPMSTAVGSVTNVTSGPGLIGGPITSSGSLYVDMGTTAGKIVQLNGSAALPAVDGSLLRFVNAIKLQSYDVSAVAPTPNQVLKWNGSTNVWEGQADVNSGGTVTLVNSGTGLVAGSITAAGTINVDVGTGANKIVQLNGTAQLPMVDGSLLTSVNAVKLQSRNVASTAPGGGQVLGYNSSTNVWEPMSTAVGSVTNVTSGPGLIGGPITSSGSLYVDMGTTAGKIVQLNGSAALPAVDGSLLRFVNAIKLQSYDVSAVAPTPNQVLKWNGSTNMWEGQSASSGTLTYLQTSTGLTGGPVTATGTIAVDVGSAAGKVVWENASAQIAQQAGAVGAPAYTFSGDTATGLYAPAAGSVSLATLGTARFTVNGQGNVGVGTTSPAAGLDIATTGTGSSFVIVPRDTTANRPVTAASVNGSIRYNTNNNALESFVNGSWQNIAVGAGVGTMSYLGTGTGLTGGPVTSTGTVAVDVGSAASKIVWENASAQIAQQAGTVGAPAYTFSGNTNTGLYSPGPGTAALATNGTSRMTIDATGNVGIGNSTPQSALHVTGNVEVTPVGGWWPATTASLLFGDNSGNDSINDVYGTGITFKIGGSQMAVIGHDGNVGFGTAAPRGILDLTATGTGSSVLIVPRDTTAGRPALAASVNGMIRYNTNNNAFEFFQNNAWVSYNTGSAGATNFPLLASPIGTPGAPAYSFSGDSDTGWYSPGAGTAALATNGTARLAVNAVGNVGIGTANPVYGLDVRGASTTQAHLSGTGADDGLYLFAFNDNSAYLNAGVGYNSGWIAKSTTASILEQSGGTLTFYSNGGLTTGNSYTPSPLFNIYANGHAGFGVTYPTYDLTFEGGHSKTLGVDRASAANTPGYDLALTAGGATSGATNRSGGNLYLMGGVSTGTGSSNIYFQTSAPGSSGTTDQNPATAMSIVGGGKVGIGTTAPAAGLDVATTGTGASFMIVPRDTTANRPVTAASVNGAIRYNTNNNAFEFFQNGSWATYGTTGGGGTGDFMANGSVPMTGSLLVVPGSASVPSIGFVGDTTTGLYRFAASQIGFSVGGTASLRILGTSAAYITAGKNRAATGTAASPTYGFENDTSAGIFGGTTILGFATASTERMRIDATGNVGIGTTSPAALLDVSGTGAYSAMIVPRDTTANRPGTSVNGMIRYNTNANAFEFFQNNAWVAYGTSGSGSVTWPLTASPNTSSAGAPQYTFGGSLTTGVFSPGTTTLAFATGGNERLRIDAAGLVGIGTSTPFAQLHVKNPVSGAPANSGTTDAAVITRVEAVQAVVDQGFVASGGAWIQPRDRANLANNWDLLLSPNGGKVGIGTIAPAAALDITATGTGASALIVPRDTTAGRPAIAASVNGMLRYNTNGNAFEFFQNGSWVTYGTSGASASVSFPLLASPIGTPAAPAYSFSGDTDTGWYSPGAGTAALATNGTARLGVDAVGRVGIGTLAPSSILNAVSTGDATLTLEGDTGNASATNAAGLMLKQDGAISTGAIGLSPLNGSANGFSTTGALKNAVVIDSYANNGTGTVQLSTQSVVRMTVDQLGNVGVGTTAPHGIMDLTATGTSSSVLIVPRDTTAGRPAIAASVNGMMRYNTNGNAFEFFQNGAWVTYNTGAGGGSATWPLTASPNTSSAGAPQYTFGGSLTTGIFSPGTTTLAFATNGAERLRVDASGKVGIGTTTPGSALTVIGVIESGTGGFRFPDGTVQTTATGGGSGGTIISSWPDSIRCTTSSFGEAVFYAAAMPYTDGRYFYCMDTSTCIYYNSSGAYSSKDTTVGTLSSCNVSIATNYSQGRAYQVVGGGGNLWTSLGTDIFFGGGNVGIGTASPRGILDLTATGTGASALIVPRDTTAGRPAIAASVNGMMRYNTNGNAFEFFQNGSWVTYGTTGSGGSVSFPLLASPIGSPSAPAYSFSGDADTGWYSAGVGTASLATNGTARLTIDSVGNVGIGTTSPTSNLSFNGQSAQTIGMERTTSTTGQNLTIKAGGAKSGGSNKDGGNLYLQAGVSTGSGVSSIHLQIQDGSAGSATSDNGLFDVLTLSELGAYLQYWGGGSNSWQNGLLVENSINNPEGAALTLAHSYNGVGGVSAGDMLGKIDFRGYTNNSGRVLGAQIRSNITSITTGQDKASITFATNKAGTLTDQMIIDWAGNVGIGTTSPRGILDLSGTGTGSSVLIVPRDTTAGRPAIAASVNGMMRYNTNGNAFEFFQNGSWVTYGTSGGGGSVTWPLLASPGTTPPSAPSYSFNSDSSTGLFSPGAGLASLVSAGTTALTAKGATVGIGTNNPNYNFSSTKLDVFSTDSNVNRITVENSLTTSSDRYPGITLANYMGGTTFGGYPVIQFYNARGSMSAPTAPNSADALGVIEFHGVSGNGGATIQSLATQNWTSGSAEGASLNFLTTANGAGSTTTRMTIDNTGYVGIGTTGPSYPLDVVNDTAPSIRVTNTTGSVYPAVIVQNYGGGAPFIRLQSAPGTQASPTVTTAGLNLGVLAYRGYNGSAWANDTNGVGNAAIAAVAEDNFTATSYPSQLQFFTTGTGSQASAQRMIITSAGNVGIGTVGPGAKLDVSGTVKLGAAGGVITGMGTCSIASTAWTTTAITSKTCTGVPSATTIVNCSPATPQTGQTYAVTATSANTVTVVASTTGTTALNCYWVQP